MQVSDLSTELGVPASAVLESCQRLGIDASWVGADLSAPDAARLRADPSLSRTADLPPTAVGSIPGFVDNDQGVAGTAEPGGAAATPRPRGRSFDRRAGTTLTLLVVGFGALVVGNQLGNIWMIVGLWVLSLGCLVASLVMGRRSWRRARVHGDRYWGGWLAPIAMVVALAGLVGLGLAVYAAASDAPAEEAPLGIGDLESVQRVRWGYQRTRALMDNGWTQPVKVVGSCWIMSDRERDQDNRPAERLEVGNVTVSCNTAHTIEVLDAYNINRDADAPYPGAEPLVADGQEQCAGVFEDAREAMEEGQADQVSLLIEIPTEQGWDDADHSVACVAVTAERTSPLLSE